MRKLRPRATATLALAPATVTDRTCALVLGLEPRVYRAFVLAEGIPCAHVGRRLVCRVDDVLAALDQLAGRVDADEGQEPEMPSAPRANRVLRLLGRERA